MGLDWCLRKITVQCENWGAGNTVGDKRASCTVVAVILGSAESLGIEDSSGFERCLERQSDQTW